MVVQRAIRAFFFSFFFFPLSFSVINLRSSNDAPSKDYFFLFLGIGRANKLSRKLEKPHASHISPAISGCISRVWLVRGKLPLQKKDRT